MNDQKMLVFMNHIKLGKTILLKDPSFSFDKRSRLFSELGISNYKRWIQRIRDEDFLVHFMEGNDLKNSFKDLREKINQDDEMALHLRQLYKETLGMDLSEKTFFPNVHELTEMLNVEIENREKSFTKEYCFIYPIVPSKKEKLLQMYQDKAIYNSQQMQDIRRFRGITKQQTWIQETANGSYIVFYQEIAGPVNDARDKYLRSKDEEFASNIAMQFSDVTGLLFEELLPSLESLFDSEILH